MANTGYKYSTWAFAKDEGGTDWDADALADDATEISNTAISLDQKSHCLVAVGALEDNTGAINGVITIYVLGDGGGEEYEDPTQGNPMAFTLTPEQNDEVWTQFSVSGREYDDFKIGVKNEAGQELAITVAYKTADVPVAS
jgi:hypothetical protein